MAELKQKLNLPKLVLFIVLLAAVAALGYGIYTKLANGSRNEEKVTYSWKEYRNDKYGFRLNYPTKWGNPHFEETQHGAGKRYSINFAGNPAEGNKKIFIIMESENAEKKVCVTESDCQKLENITKTYVEKKLSENKDNSLSYNNNYALINTDPEHGLQSGLEIYSIKSLPSINVSAIHAGYYILGSAVSCPKNKISNNPECIDSSIFETTDKVIKSLGLL